MRRLALLATVALAGCPSAGPHRTYDNNVPELGTGYAAMLTCNCRFVMEMPDDYCRAWVKVSPDVGRFTVDPVKKTVESSAILVWGGRARFVDERLGCVLE